MVKCSEALMDEGLKMQLLCGGEKAASTSSKVEKNFPWKEAFQVDYNRCKE